jgi:hypothetical protein
MPSSPTLKHDNKKLESGQLSTGRVELPLEIGEVLCTAPRRVQNAPPRVPIAKLAPLAIRDHQHAVFHKTRQQVAADSLSVTVGQGRCGEVPGRTVASVAWQICHQHKTLAKSIEEGRILKMVDCEHTVGK